MLPRLALALLALATLLEPASASAYIVVPNHRDAIQRGVHAAMRCPDMLPGNYVVEVTLHPGPDGGDVTARVITAPRILYETEQCIVFTFAHQRFAETRRTERIEAPFVLLSGVPYASTGS